MKHENTPVQEFDLTFNLQRFSEDGSGAEDYSDPGDDGGYDDGDDDNQSDYIPFGEDEPEALGEQSQDELDYGKFLEDLSSKAKYNKEPLTISSYDELIEKVQKGANYDKVYDTKSNLERELESVRNSTEIRLARELANRYGFDSVEEYEQAVRESWEQEEIDRLTENDIPEELAREILESRRFKEQFEAEQQAKGQQEAETAMYSEFLKHFPEADASKIPAEVWGMVDAGRDLSSAYALYQVKNMNSVKVDAQQEAIRAMARNAETSTGSINSGNSAEEASMSVEQVNSILEGMSSNEQARWVDKNMSNLEKWGYFKNF